ncbi:hypothetical protein [Paenibacillus sp. 1P03SA]|uniref:hypothetical protein n=1 Tax=Paenibacillus sp. 1P03SA TaxID=3132294 RepID=UPI0039A32F30
MTETFVGLETARLEFNNWCGNAVIFIDFEENEAFCRVFEIPTYHSDKIIILYSKGDLYSRNDKIGSERLNKLAAAKLEKYKEGWSKLDLETHYYFPDF